MKKILTGSALGILFVILTGAFFASCKKKDTIAPPSPIGGFNNSNEVGASNLKAHWTLDGSLNESISSTAPTTSAGTSFVTGVKGQAVNLANGYILYPVIA